MTAGARRALRLGARAAGLLLVAYVVLTQVRWHDEVRLADGSVLVGRITEAGRIAEGGRVAEGASSTALGVEPADGGAPRQVAAAEIATERYGGRDLPRVAYGLGSLGRRLSERSDLVALVVLGLLALEVLTAFRWRWLVHALALRLSALDALRFTAYGLFFNLVVPGATGGDVVRAYYAAKRTGAPARAVVSVLVDRVVGLAALVLLAAGVLFLGPDHEGFRTPRAIVLAVLGVAAVVAALFLSRRVRGALGLRALLARLPFQRVLREADAAFRLYRHRPGFLSAALAVSFVNHVGVALGACVLAQAMGIRELTPGASLALMPVIGLLTAVPLLPGGWGVGELAFAFFLGPLGVAPSEAVGLSVVYRLIMLSTGLPGGVLWFLARDPARASEMAHEVALAEAEAAAAAQGPA